MTPGDRVRLDKVGDDREAPPIGTLGLVVDAHWLRTWDVWQVLVEWDDGHSTTMIVPPDVLTVTRGEEDA